MELPMAQISGLSNLSGARGRVPLADVAVLLNPDDDVLIAKSPLLPKTTLVSDGEDDLVVLDYAEDSDLTVSVWRWHGWGFSLMWRSAPGAYRDLILVPGEDGAPSTIVAVLGP